MNFVQLFQNKGDLEVDRLLSDIDDSVKLLPYMLLTDETTHDAERALQPLRVENSQLRRFVSKKTLMVIFFILFPTSSNKKRAKNKQEHEQCV